MSGAVVLAGFLHVGWIELAACQLDSSDMNMPTRQAPRGKRTDMISCFSADNAQVSDESQPPMTFDLSLCESAGSRSLDRGVGRSVHILSEIVDDPGAISLCN